MATTIPTVIPTMTVLRKHGTPGGVGAGQRAVASLARDVTYHTIYLRVTNNGAAVTDWSIIKEIKLIVSGQTKIEVPGATMAKLCNFYGVTREAGYLPIILARPWMRSAFNEDHLAWGMADQSSFVLEVEFDATAVSPTLELYSEVSAASPLYQHVEIHAQSFEIASIGLKEFADFPEINSGLFAAHIDTDKISQVTVKRNNMNIWEDVPTSMLKSRDQAAQLAPRAWQAGFTHLDFMHRDRLTDAVPMNANDLRLKMTTETGATGNRTIITERRSGAAPNIGGR